MCQTLVRCAVIFSLMALSYLHIIFCNLCRLFQLGYGTVVSITSSSIDRSVASMMRCIVFAEPAFSGFSPALHGAGVTVDAAGDHDVRFVQDWIDEQRSVRPCPTARCRLNPRVVSTRVLLRWRYIHRSRALILVSTEIH